MRCSNPERGQALVYLHTVEGRIRCRVLLRHFARLAVREYEAGALLGEERIDFEDPVAAERGLRIRAEEWEAVGWATAGYAVYFQEDGRFESDTARRSGAYEYSADALPGLRAKHAEGRKARARRHARYEKLHAAVAEGRVDDALALLEKGYPRTPADCFFEPALELAALRGYTPLVDRLTRTKDHLELAIVIAAGAGQLPLLRHLIDQRGGDPDAREMGRTALMTASQGGHLEVVDYLLACGADADYTSDGRNASDLAMAAGHEAVARRIAAAGDASPAYQTKRLFEAVESGNADDVARFAAPGAQLDAHNERGETPLHVAIQRGYGDAKLVAALLEAGADPSRPSADGFTPWMACKRWDDPVAADEQARIAALLERAGATKQGMEFFELHDAARDGDVARVEALLAGGLHPDAGPLSRSPLAAAAANGHVDVVDLLLARGAALDRCEEGRPTALIRAAQRGKLAVVQQLVRAGANVDHEDGHVGNAADHAALNRNPEIVTWLQAHGSKADRAVGARFEKPPRARLGWKLFARQAVQIGNGEYSVILVEAPIAESAPALAGLIDGSRHFASIDVQPASVSRHAWPVYAVQLTGQRWTIFVHAIGSLSWHVFDLGRELAAALARGHGWRIVYASQNDTDCETWFRLIEPAGATAGKDPALLRTLGIQLPGFDPWPSDGLRIIGVTRADVARVDVIETPAPGA
jgi:ankyrin repeat protein